jgi:hypothetical protein
MNVIFFSVVEGGRGEVYFSDENLQCGSMLRKRINFLCPTTREQFFTNEPVISHFLGNLQKIMGLFSVVKAC